MAVNLGVYREQSLETWELMAPGWQDRREWLSTLTGPVTVAGGPGGSAAGRDFCRHRCRDG